MTLEEMKRRAETCGDHPLNRDDRVLVIVYEVWTATIEICKRLDLLFGNSQKTEAEAEAEAEAETDCKDSPGNKCLFEYNGLREDPTCAWCGRT